jgi:hypothetical protein
MRRLALLIVPFALACGEKDITDSSDTGDVPENVDVDGDGVDAMDDCDDNDADNFPGNTETCDGADNDCDGVADNGVLLGGFADSDGDGYGAPDQAAEGCEYGNGFVENDLDCDDSDDDISPDAVEICDGLDNDCDRLIDSEDDSVDMGTATTWFGDGDNDGFGDASDTQLSCDQPSGYVLDDTDCDPDDSAQYPGADEYCNGEDDDCNEVVDDDYALDALTFYEDGDEDGFGDIDSTTASCSEPDGYTSDDTDCDDNDDDIFPGADEYCDEVDNDCNGTDDDDDAVDADTWYVDDDVDGFGDATDSGTASCSQPSGYELDNTDCDDSENAINPDADEVCDGADNDCDASTGEDDMATFTDSAGTESDVSTDVSGSSSSPAAYTLSSEGELAFCDGTFYVNLTVEADVDIFGFNGDATTAILDGGENASVIAIATDGLEVGVADVTIQNGYGDTTVTANAGTSVGGGIFCEGSSSEISLAIEDTVFSTNDAEYGGALFGYMCGISVTGSTFDSNTAYYGGALLTYEIDATIEDSTFSGNDAYGGGAVYFHNSTADLLEVDVESNTATVAAGLWVDESDLVLETVSVDSNTGDYHGGVLALYGSDLDWTGTSSDDSGITNNIDSSGDYGGLSLVDSTATFDTVDFGTSNSDYDIWLNDSNGTDIWYFADDDGTFDCDADSCGTGSSTNIGTTSSSGGNYLLGDVVLATTDGTIDSFAPYTYASSSCSMNFYLMSNSSNTGSGWEVLWASTGNTPSNTSSNGYEDSPTVGIPVESGTYYAFAWDVPDCSTSGYGGGTASTTAVAGVGTFQSSNCLYISQSTDEYSEGDTVDGTLGCGSTFQLAMEITATDL